jgi:adenylate cyclase
MNARAEQKLRLLAAIIVVGTIAGVAVNLGQGHPLAVGAAFGFITSVVLGGVELFVLGGPMRDWLGGLSFTASLMIRSAITPRLSWSSSFSHRTGSLPGCRSGPPVKISGPALSLPP